MARHIFAACGALAIAGVTLAGQSSSPSQPPQPSTTTPSMAPAASITVQGCLKPASGSTSTGSPSATGTTGTTGSPSTAAGGAQYMLTDAEIKTGAAGSGATGATGTTGTGTTGAPTTGSPAGRSGAMDADEFMLRAEGASVNLSQHVNQQVEVVGRMAASGAPMSGTTGTSGTGTTGTGTTGTGSTASRPSGSGDRPTLTVTSVKMIAAACK